MTNPAERDRVLALGGLMLAIGQVRDIARHGQADGRRTRPCMSALLGQYDGDVAALYGGVDALAPGLRLLADHLGAPQDHEITRYLVGLLQLEKKLARRGHVFQTVLEGIRRAGAQADYFGNPTHPNVISNLGALYTETVSNVRPRIMVQGDPGYLQDENNAAMIRALLLSGLRAAALWRGAGGSRLRLILARGRTVETARRLLTVT